jgi:SAM-dependent methyltransferase
MPDLRARARQLAAEYALRGDPTGWFDQLYRESAQGLAVVPWADLRPNPNLVTWWERNEVRAKGAALKIGCGLGGDAEQLSGWGFETVAFDIAPAAIQECKKRFPGSAVSYVVADLLSPPESWRNRFEFVLESYTLQVLPAELRARALVAVAGFVKPGGHLLAIARGRDVSDPPGQMPWPLTRAELDSFLSLGFDEKSFEDYMDGEDPPARRFRGHYYRSV